MNVATALPLLALAVTVAATPGCFFNPDIDDMVHALEDELDGVELEPEMRLRFGRASMGLARTALRWAEDDDPDVAMASDILDGVREVHLGIYEVWGLDETPRLPRSICDELDDGRWSLVVEARDWSSGVWVLSQVRRDEVSGLYVVSIDGHELVVVKLHGDLTRAIDSMVRGAMRGDGAALAADVRTSARHSRGRWD